MEEVDGPKIIIGGYFFNMARSLFIDLSQGDVGP